MNDFFETLANATKPDEIPHCYTCAYFEKDQFIYQRLSGMIRGKCLNSKSPYYYNKTKKHVQPDDICMEFETYKND